MLAAEIQARALATIAAGLAPPPDMSPSEWTEAHRRLDASAALPGKFSFDATPYFRKPLDDLSTTSGIKTVVVCAGAQLGKTELLLSAVCYWIANDPKPIMCVWPTVDVAKRVIMSRLDPALAVVPEVKARLIPERSRKRGNTTFHKRLIGGGDLIITGANAPAPLRSSPINFALLDEVSAFPGSTDEGDVLDLVAARQYTYPHTAKTLLTSTPLDEGTCRITRAYLETSQQKYFVPCLQCGHAFVITFADIQWPKGQPDKAVLVCPSCGRPHDDFDKPEQLRNGEWRGTAEGGDPTMAGYWISGLYSPWLRYGAIAAQHAKVRKDPPRLRVFVNTVLAETWRVEDGEGLKDEGLPGRRIDHGGVLPADTLLVTVGVDVQDDRLEVQFIAWHAEERATVFRHVILYGDPSGKQVWSDLDDLLHTPIPHARAVPDLVPRAVCVDSGGHHTSAVYAYCRAHARERYWAVKGRGGPGVPIWPKRAGKGKGGANVFTVGVDQCKSILYGRLRNGEAGAPGYIGFDASLSDPWFTQLTAERVVTRYSKGHPVREWVLPDKARNEALDCFVYALAALHGLYSMGLDLGREMTRLMDAPLKAEAPAGPVRVAMPSTRPRVPIRSSYLQRG